MGISYKTRWLLAKWLPAALYICGGLVIEISKESLGIYKSPTHWAGQNQSLNLIDNKEPGLT